MILMISISSSFTAFLAASFCVVDDVPGPDIDSSIKAICLNGTEVELMYVNVLEMVFL